MMVSLGLVLAAIGLLGLSGLPACLLPARSPAGQRLATALMAGGSLLGLAGLALAFGAAAPPALELPWGLPWGRFRVALDAISILFLAPVFVVPLLGSLYGLGYWPQAAHPENGRRLGCFYGLLAGAMALVAIARDGVLFLVAWEAMALAAYFAATLEEENPEVRRAGWVYLVATHAGTLCLIAMFALWRQATGSFALVPAPPLPAALAGTLFVLALIGFGFKAGLMPLHVWLPGAHANAPSHVSAVMSGVMLKMGIYGLVRMTAVLPTPAAWWGGTLLAVGAATGVAGIAYALGQQDCKRLLAYSSIENIGIIALGLGLALLGRSLERADWVLLGLGGALLHVWNHSLFKSLLFLATGAIIHATHTREMDRLGGLAKQMPRTMALFLLGAVAICALPPLNGFASEWLLYVGLFRTLGLGGAAGCPAAALGAVALAMVGALATAGFVKLAGTVFLGSPRTEATRQAHDPGASMLLPMGLLAAGCVGLGLFPMLAAPLLAAAAHAWTPMPGLATAAAELPLPWITRLGLGLVALAAVLALAVMALLRGRPRASVATWDCGYARPTPRMQYTGASFGQSLVGLFSFLLWPKPAKLALRTLFPPGATFASRVPDAILDRLVRPLFALLGRQLPRLHLLQPAQTHLYLLYILAILITLLLWGG
ncbi:MAG: proton-conducting transporter membrane subunit [Lentisphaeria bacterium]|jgi:hydrogenase-4 component B